ncbi:hypothetical protein SDC9_48491 [bioreactor metagenome]|uniref:Uncharacterized protein n=1 Tax=bioreactor metagenome TaxID=1076179 RepID=A0A644WEG9_9ZZZZ
MFVDLVGNRHEGGGTVVLGPVELDASADPGSKEADQRRLDHLIIVDCILTGCLVYDPVDASTELRQYHHFQVVVFQEYSTIRSVFLGITNRFNDGVGVDSSAAALVNPVLKEHRVGIGLSCCIGGDHNLFFPDSCLHTCLLLIVHCSRKSEEPIKKSCSRISNSCSFILPCVSTCHGLFLCAGFISILY